MIIHFFFLQPKIKEGDKFVRVRGCFFKKKITDNNIIGYFDLKIIFLMVISNNSGKDSLDFYSIGREMSGFISAISGNK